MKTTGHFNSNQILPFKSRLCACGELIGEHHIPTRRISDYKIATPIIKGLSVLDNITGLKYGFSSKSFGNMGYKYGLKKEVLKNRRGFANALGFSLKKSVNYKVIHGANIEIATFDHAGKGAYDIETGVEGVDGLITTEKNLPLILTTGDCASIILTTKNSDVLALIHAGRKSTDRLIAKQAVKKLSSMGFSPKDLIVGIGPSIQKNCYRLKYMQTKTPYAWLPWITPTLKDAKIHVEIGVNIRDGYKITVDKGSLMVDVIGYNVSQLIGAGVNPENISVAPVCTSCLTVKNELYSHFLSNKYKKSNLYPEGRFAAVAVLK